jgi:Cu(I)/Ag(I) efflux system membrane protein CusA/SilA
MNDALKLPGLANGWTMPIKGRNEMLSTGFRTPIGLKISGADVNSIEKIGAQVEFLLPSVKGTRNVFAERTGSGYFLDFDWNREALARYGLSIDEVQEVIQSAIGGDNVTTTIEGGALRGQRATCGTSGPITGNSRILVPVSEGKQQIP